MDGPLKNNQYQDIPFLLLNHNKKEVNVVKLEIFRNGRLAMQKTLFVRSLRGKARNG